MASGGPAQRPTQQQGQQGGNKRPSRWTGQHSFASTAATPSQAGNAAAAAAPQQQQQQQQQQQPQTNYNAARAQSPLNPAAASKTAPAPAPAAPASSNAGTSSNAGGLAQIAASQDELARMHDRMLFLFANLIGHPVRCTLRSGIVYTGVLSAVNDSDLSICLKLARQVESVANSNSNSKGTSTPSAAAPKPSLVVAARDVIDLYAENVSLDSNALAARPTSPGTGSTSQQQPHSIASALSGGARNGPDSFKTDVDISAAGLPRDQRELQRWGVNGGGAGATGGGLEDGSLEGPSLSASRGKSGAAGGAWDQFAVNERLFGTRTNYQEELYTTKLDKTGADYKAREAKAAKIAEEIQSGAAINSHVAEERGGPNSMATDDSGMDEEDKYSGVQRGQNAYVPPGARRAMAASGQGAKQTQAVPAQQQQAPAGAAKANGSVTQALRPVTSSDGKERAPSVQVAPPSAAPAGTATAGTAAAGATPVKEDLVGDFKKFVSNEKEKLTQKRSQLEKQNKDKKMAELKQFSQSFVLKMPVPADLVPILAKDEQKQKELANRKPSAAATLASANNVSGPGAQKPASTHTSPNPPPAALKGAAVPPSQQLPPRLAGAVSPSAGVPSGAASKPAAAKKPSPWAVADIPAFDSQRAAAARAAKAAAAANAGNAAAPAAAGTSKLHAAAKEFVFRPGAGAFVPGGAAPFVPGAAAAAAAAAPFVPAPSANAAVPIQAPPQSSSAMAKKASDQQSGTPAPAANQPFNPFFGHRVIRTNSNAPFRVKEDFSPFKRNEKIPDPATVQPAWGFTGKTYKAAAAYAFPGTSAMHHMLSPQQSHALPPHLQQAGSARNMQGTSSPGATNPSVSRASSSQGPSGQASTAATSTAVDDGGASKAGTHTPVPASTPSTSTLPPSANGIQHQQSGGPGHGQPMHIPGQPHMVPQGFVLQPQQGQPYPPFRYGAGGAMPGQSGQPHHQQPLGHHPQQQLQQLQQQMQGHAPAGSQIVFGPNGQPMAYMAQGQFIHHMPFSPSMHASGQPMFSPQMAHQMPPGQHYMQPVFVQPGGARGQAPQIANAQHPQHTFYSQMQASPGMHQQFVPMSQQHAPAGQMVYEQSGQ